MDYRQRSLLWLQSHLGYVLQQPHMFSGTIRDNIAYGNPEADDAAIVEAAKRANIHDFILSLKDGYQTYVGERGIKLSGGQKQRLSIARALVKKPEILILDDSSSALDFATDAALRRAIHALSGSMTTFIVSQRIACIRQADKILVLDNGRLAGTGTHDELMRACALYREIYFSQFPEERAAYEKGGEGAC